MKIFAPALIVWTWQVCCSSPIASEQNGSNVQLKEYAHHALLRIKYSKKYFICEGVVISEHYVLTAAGCVQKYKSDLQSLEIILGATSTETADTDKGVIKKSIAAIEFPPEWYSSNQTTGDIALIKLSSVIAQNERVNKAPYGNPHQEGKIYDLVGYGPEEYIHNVQIIIASKAECEKSLGFRQPSDQNCAKVEENGDIFTDEWFAGAPVMNSADNNHVYHIVGAKNNASLTCVSCYKEWIDSTVYSSESRSSTSHTTSSIGSSTPIPSTTINSTKQQTTTSFTDAKPTEETTEDNSEEYSEETTEENSEEYSEETTTSVSSTTTEAEETTDSDESAESSTTPITTTTEDTSSEEESTEESIEEESTEVTSSTPSSTTTSPRTSSITTEDYMDENMTNNSPSDVNQNSAEVSNPSSSISSVVSKVSKIIDNMKKLKNFMFR